jgi:hypothetical protein
MNTVLFSQIFIAGAFLLAVGGSIYFLIILKPKKN